MNGFRAILLVAFTPLVGCTGPAPPPTETHGEWTALQDLQMDTLMMIGPDASMGNWSAVKNQAATDAFKKGVEAFTNSAMPASMSNQEENKTKVVNGLNQLIGAAKSGGGADEMKGAWEQIQAALKELNAASTAAAEK